MPTLKRTRRKAHETDSESSGSPTIGKQSTKRTKGKAPTTHHKPRSSSVKLAVYIVAVKLGPGRTVDGLSKLVEDSSDYVLARNVNEADVFVTGIGTRQRLERSVPAELIVSCSFPIHVFREYNPSRYPRTRNPLSPQLGWKSRSKRVNSSHTINIKLCTSGKVMPPATIVTTQSMERSPLPALRVISARLPSLPVSVNRLSFVLTRSSSSSLTSSKFPGSLM